MLVGRGGSIEVEWRERSLLLICDVDGVIRQHTETPVDPRALQSLKQLASHPNVHITFISGTPIAQNPSLEVWRRANSTLDVSVGQQFLDEIQRDKVTLFGALGGQCMGRDGQVIILEEYPLEIIFEIGKLLLRAFLREVLHDGSSAQKQTAASLSETLEGLSLNDKEQSSNETPIEFADIINAIRKDLDPLFKLVSYGTFIESHTSHPPWHAVRSAAWMKEMVSNPSLDISKYDFIEKQVGSGLAYRKEDGFNFLMVSKTNKGRAIERHVAENLKRYADPFIITIGDTQVDFPMHHLADLSFHVGKESVWQSHDLNQCYLVLDESGNDSQHVNGTLYVLDILNKSF